MITKLDKLELEAAERCGFLDGDCASADAHDVWMRYHAQAGRVCVRVMSGRVLLDGISAIDALELARGNPAVESITDTRVAIMPESGNARALAAAILQVMREREAVDDAQVEPIGHGEPASDDDVDNTATQANTGGTTEAPGRYIGTFQHRMTAPAVSSAGSADDE